MHRSPLQKIVMIQESNEHLLKAVRAAAPSADVVVAREHADIDREIVDAQVVVGGIVSEDQLRSASELAWHHVPWVGVERIVSPVYAEQDIVLTNGSGVNAANIAEHVVAMMLAFARQIPLFVRDQDRATWRGWGDAPTFFELGGQRVLCLGTGDIGQEVARRLAAFGCQVIGASRSGRALSGFDHCVSFDDLENELGLADHVVSSLPLTESTSQIYSRDRIRATKNGAYFYNVGRGGTVDQDALIEALEQGRLAGAGLDVVEPEPLPAESPLWAMKHVIITGHTSGNSPQAMERMAELTVAQLQRYQAGDDLLNVVDVTAGY
jgi:phosphoglycerate dehydrogenase-like enzyme